MPSPSTSTATASPPATTRRCPASYKHISLPPLLRVHVVACLPHAALPRCGFAPPNAATRGRPTTRAPCATAPAKRCTVSVYELFEWALEGGLRRRFEANTSTARAAASAHAGDRRRAGRQSSRLNGGCGVKGTFAYLTAAAAATLAACQRLSIRPGRGGRQWTTERPWLHVSVVGEVATGASEGEKPRGWPTAAVARGERAPPLTSWGGVRSKAGAAAGRDCYCTVQTGKWSWENSQDHGSQHYPVSMLHRHGCATSSYCERVFRRTFRELS